MKAIFFMVCGYALLTLAITAFRGPFTVDATVQTAVDIFRFGCSCIAQLFTHLSAL
jgi:hypothetical protein